MNVLALQWYATGMWHERIAGHGCGMRFERISGHNGALLLFSSTPKAAVSTLGAGIKLCRPMSKGRTMCLPVEYIMARLPRLLCVEGRVAIEHLEHDGTWDSMNMRWDWQQGVGRQHGLGCDWRVHSKSSRGTMRTL